jgi:NTP pyrophosphatase (non-canonical NTP hydrolase)
MLSFERLRDQNGSRVRRWHKGFPEDDDWNKADWSNAMCGEAGELANVIKKIRRNETHKVGNTPGVDGDLLIKMAADELADVITYADLLADKLGIDLAEAVADKFNRVSIKHGFPERL